MRQREEDSRDEYIRALAKRMGVRVHQRGHVILSKKDLEKLRKGRRKDTWKKDYDE